MARTRYLRSLVFIYTTAVTFTKVKYQFALDVAYLPYVGHICPNLELATCYTYGDLDLDTDFYILGQCDLEKGQIDK